MKYRHFKNTGNLIEEGVKLLREHMQMTCTVPHAVMLSGGRTPLPIYESIAGEPFASSGNLYLLMSDERMAPRDSPENNLANADQMITALHIPGARILAVNTALPHKEAAQDYNDAISGFFAQGGRLTLSLLGIGADGHTASLFSISDLDNTAGKYAVPILRSPPPYRVSITPDTIKRAERIVFLAVGKEKEEIVRRLRTNPDSVIAGRVVENVSNVEIWCAQDGTK